jgi:hypothetical protein
MLDSSMQTADLPVLACIAAVQRIIIGNEVFNFIEMHIFRANSVKLVTIMQL